MNVSDFQVSMSDVYKKLSALDASKGPAPDGIPPCLIKQCSFILARPLCFIFNEPLASKHQIYAIYPDLKKAFDKITHTTLI